jgi:adenylate cyclase
MADEDYKRKLAAILSADVEGYSRLMVDDEGATVRTLSTYRNSIIDLTRQFRGRVVDSPGDNILAEFSSVVDAVNCAVEIQRVLAELNSKLPDNRKMAFRIGVNLDDVIEEDGRIYGDGVNTAARVESMAEAGGICISGAAYDHVESKLGLEYIDLGEHKLKNIPRPVLVYRIGKAPEASDPRVSRKLMIPEKPSIAVLPFVNISGDLEREYFVDGITNDIITDLFEFKHLFVIAANSTFTYKGKPVKVKDVSEELGVRYVLEGSVQRSGDRMRINAQLIDATSGKHLWAERYDLEAQRLFDIQDEIVETIVATLAFEVDSVERERAMRKGPKNLSAYDYLLQGRNIWFRYTKEANAEAASLFQKAMELDPNWPMPYGWLAWVHTTDSMHGWSENPEKSMELALKLAQKSYAMAPNSYKIHWLLGYVYLQLRDFDRAIAGYERALAINSNDADFLAQMASALTSLGRSEQAIAQLKKAMRINPRHPSWYWSILGEAYYQVGQYKEALATLKQNNNPWFSTHRTLAAVYVRLDRLEEARAEVSKILEIYPDYTLKSENNLPYKDENRRERIINDLRKAGVPE